MSAYCSRIQNRQLVNFEAGVHAQDPNIQTTKEAGPSAFSGSNSVGSVGGSHGHGGAGGEGDECKYSTRCGAAGSLARVVAMDTLNAADPDTMSATTRPRPTPHLKPYHSQPSLTLSIFTLHSGDCIIYCDL